MKLGSSESPSDLEEMEAEPSFTTLPASKLRHSPRYCEAGVKYSQSLVQSFSTCSTKRAKRQHFSSSVSVRGLWNAQFSQTFSLSGFILTTSAFWFNGRRCPVNEKPSGE